MKEKSDCEPSTENQQVFKYFTKCKLRLFSVELYSNTEFKKRKKCL